MEKKEMSFIEKFAAAGEELEKAMVVSKKDAMIMIATSEGNDGRSVSASVQGKSGELLTLLSLVAIKEKEFKKILTDAIRIIEAWEQRNKKRLWKRKKLALLKSLMQPAIRRAIHRLYNKVFL